MGGHPARHPIHAARAWFNPGTLHQQRGEIELAVAAYRGAIEYRHPEIGPRAAVNLGFVLFTELGQVEQAEAAFQVAINGSDPEQAQLGRQNLAARRQLAADRRRGLRHDGVEEPKDLSVGRARAASGGPPGSAATGPDRPALTDRCRTARRGPGKGAAPGAPSYAWCGRPGHVHVGRAA